MSPNRKGVVLNIMIKHQDQPAKTDEEINKSRPEDTNLDRDGRERHPTEQDQPDLREEGHPKARRPASEKGHSLAPSAKMKTELI